MLSSEWATSTCNIIVPDQAKAAADWLNQHHISSRKWWGDGCHTMPAFQNAPGLYPLKNTEYLRQSVLGLPFYPDMAVQDITAVVNCLQEMLQLPTEIAI
jgi:dTDP-4-amino-4,6-dideoxygalactose transaminase